MTSETPNPLDVLRSCIEQAEAGWWGDQQDGYAALAQVAALAEAARLGDKWLDLNYGYLKSDEDPLLRAFADALRAALVPFAAHENTND